MAKTDELKSESKKQRFELLHELETRMEYPLLFLSFVWLILMIVEFTIGLSPFLESMNTTIWVLFVVDFAIKFTIAPAKSVFLKNNLILAASLALPALRLFRISRAFRLWRSVRAVQGLRLVRLLSSLNRGIKALGRSLGRRGFGYVASLTVLVTLAGAAGILAFEKNNGVITDYGTSIWWTAMLLTTMGSDYFPRSSEGRLLCLFLATYGFAVFGYVTATVATFFVGRDAEDKESELAGQKTLDEIRIEIRELKEELRAISLLSGNH